MKQRFFIHLALAIVLLFATSTYVLVLSGVNRVHIKKSLAYFPYSFGEWKGSASAISDWELKYSGVDDHMMRIYSRGAGPDVWVYVGYYESQGEGKIIHPPKNCLPASGWLPVLTSREVIDFRGGQVPTIEVTRYLVQKGEEKDLVVYWYHSRGRIVASEYLDRLYLIWDSISRKRSDGALVTVSCSAGENWSGTWPHLADFIRDFFPILYEDFLDGEAELESRL